MDVHVEELRKARELELTIVITLFCKLLRLTAIGESRETMKPCSDLRGNVLFLLIGRPFTTLTSDLNDCLN